MSSGLKLLAISALLLLLLPVSFPWVSASSEDNATLAITQAEESLSSAYEAVLEAEQVGANVSELLDRLNIAAEHLAEAQMLFRLRDFDGAVHSADISKSWVDMTNEAEQLKIDAQGSWSASLLIRVTGSIVGVIAVILGTFVAWRVFKRR